MHKIAMVAHLSPVLGGKVGAAEAREFTQLMPRKSRHTTGWGREEKRISKDATGANAIAKHRREEREITP